MERAGLKNTKQTRDANRDISEKIALGQAQPSSKEAMYDQRLFNQTAGLGAGFGHEDDYNLYDKPLFADRTATSIYRGVMNIDVDKDVDDAGGDQQGDGTSRVRKMLGQAADTTSGGFDGAKDENNNNSRVGGGRSKPVEFEKTRLATADQEVDYKAGLQKR